MNYEHPEGHATHYSEALLRDFARTIDLMTIPTLLKLRADCVTNIPCPSPDDPFLDIIDGNLALREIRALQDA
jgi:hypothetical protein